MEATLIVTVIALAAFVQSSVGFGFGTVAVPLLAFLLPVSSTAAFVLIFSSLLSFKMAIEYHRDIKIHKLSILFVSIVIGSLLPLLLSLRVDEVALQGALSIFLVLFAIIELFKIRMRFRHMRLVQL